MAQAKMQHPVFWVIFAGMAALLLSQGRERRGERSPGGRRMRGPTAGGCGMRIPPQSGDEHPSGAGTELRKGPQPAGKLRGMRMRERRRNSRCTGLAAGGTLLPWRPDYFCGCGRTLPSQHNPGRISDPTGWGAGGAGVPLCSPPRLCFSSKVVRKTRAASWEVLSQPVPDQHGCLPPAGGCCSEGRRGLCKGKKKKSKKRWGKEGGRGGRSQPHLAGSAEPVSSR